MKMAWLEEDAYVTQGQGGGTIDYDVSGAETFSELTEKIKAIFNSTCVSEVIGLKIGKFGSDILTSFPPDITTFSQYIKKNKMYYSKIKVYLVTKIKKPHVECTCSDKMPRYAMSFKNDNVSCHDKKAACSFLALANPENSECNPLCEVFTLKSLTKCLKCKISFLDWIPDGDTIGYTFNQAKKSTGLLHGPDELHGTHHGYFLGVVSSKHRDNQHIKWFRNGTPYDEGSGLCVIWPTEDGVYHVTVDGMSSKKHKFMREENSASVAQERKSNSDVAPAKRNREAQDQNLLQLDPKDIKYDPAQHEIGEGCFGRVYKADMLGTNVAYKLCKIGKRELAAGIEKVILTEIKIHSNLHHPNIVQFLGYVRTPTSIGLVCEYITGNLERFIFGSEEDDSPEMELKKEQKVYIIIQCLQGLTYLHAMQIILSDIKPTNGP